MKQPKVYTATSQGRNVMVFDAHTGAKVSNMIMPGDIEQLVVSGNTISVVWRRSAHGKTMHTYTLPNFTHLISRNI
jgi:hypothetical protein